MSEKLKYVRLSKVCLLFDQSLDRAIEILAKNGINVERNPNAKLTEDEYIIFKNLFPEIKATDPFDSPKQKQNYPDFFNLKEEIGKKCSICGMYEWCGTDSCPNDPT